MSRGLALPARAVKIRSMKQSAPSIVRLSGGGTGRYVVLEEGAGGKLVIAPDDSAAASRERMGAEQVTEEEFLTEFGDLPSDHEG